MSGDCLRPDGSRMSGNGLRPDGSRSSLDLKQVDFAFLLIRLLGGGGGGGRGGSVYAAFNIIYVIPRPPVTSNVPWVSDQYKILIVTGNYLVWNRGGWQNLQKELDPTKIERATFGIYTCVSIDWASWTKVEYGWLQVDKVGCYVWKGLVYKVINILLSCWKLMGNASNDDDKPSNDNDEPTPFQRSNVDNDPTSWYVV